MTESAVPKDREATRHAVFGLIVQFVVAGVLGALAWWAHSDLLDAAARFAAAGILVWFALLLVFKQVERVNAEAREAEELKRARAEGADSALFEIDEEALHIERRKFQGLLRWMLPGTTLVLAAGGLAAQFAFWDWSVSAAWKDAAFTRTEQPTIVIWFVLGLLFICFAASRGAVGLARQREWRLLRSGAAFLMGCAIVCAVAVIGLLPWGRTFPAAEPLAASAIRILTVIISLEFLLNFVADFYRPRMPGAVPRPGFDSRLLGLVTEPGGIAKSVADAINYQFGFEVSRTWFYQLLAATLLPLTLLTMIFVLLLSSVVMIDADEAAVIQRFGRTVQARGEVLGPGFYLKWPWPIETVRRAPVTRIQQMIIGDTPSEPEIDPQTGKEKVVLWTEEHKFKAEMLLIVGQSRDAAFATAGGTTGETSGQAVSVNAVMASVPIHYRIVDLHQYLFEYEEPDRLLEALAYRRLSEMASSVDLETMMGAGRGAFNERLAASIQREVEEAGLGLELTFCGVESVHPPSEANVAKTFQEVISAEAKRRDRILSAEGEAEQVLTTVAGSVGRARELDAAIVERDLIAKQATADPERLAEAEAKIDRLLFGDAAAGLTPVGGEAAVRLAHARQITERRVSDAAVKARSFASELAAYKASPKLYEIRKKLEVFDGLDQVRKYLIIGDPSRVLIEYENVEPTRLDLSEKP